MMSTFRKTAEFCLRALAVVAIVTTFLLVAMTSRYSARRRYQHCLWDQDCDIFSQLPVELDTMEGDDDVIKEQDDLYLHHDDQGMKFVDKRMCKPKKNLVFIKVHKCASSALGTMLAVHGIKNDLNFALPKSEKGHIGWPEPLQMEHIHPEVPKDINMLVHHSVYNEATLSKLMPKDTFYLAILRYPLDQFISTMNYFQATTQLNLQTEDTVSEFLHDPEKYEGPIHFISNGKYLGSKSITRNFMLTDLGFNIAKSDNKPSIKNYIKYLDEKFDLILIQEYFVESLVLLRRKLCWTQRDVVCLRVNPNKYEPRDNRQDLLEKHKQWSRGDYMLYDYFNKTFWTHVREQKTVFNEEVSVFTAILEKLVAFCKNVKWKKIEKDAVVEIEENEFGEGFTFKSVHCDQLRVQPYQWTKYLWDKMEAKYKEERKENEIGNI